MNSWHKPMAVLGAFALTSAGLAGCGSAGAAPGTGGAAGKVRLVAHASFVIPSELKQSFKQQSGFDLEVIQVDEAGTMAAQLILSADNPVADVVAGLDNTFASRVVQAGVLEPYVAPAGGPEQAKYAADLAGWLTAIDMSDVCINYDKSAYTTTPAPTGLADLIKPAYRDQLVVENPATASPGMAFMLATVAAYGEDGWLDYWRALQANGVKISPSWQDAYYSEFSGPSSSGRRPLVVSYASSPPAEVVQGGDGSSGTAALLDTCFRQVEYAGVLRGADNPTGAQALVDYLLTDEFQTALPTTMWVYPINEQVMIPTDWVDLAPLAADPWVISPGEISKNREVWLKEWIEVVLG